MPGRPLCFCLSLLTLLFSQVGDGVARAPVPTDHPASSPGESRHQEPDASGDILRLAQAGGEPEEPDSRLTAAELRRLQGLLNALGLDAGPEDGLMGPRTGAAIRALQENEGLPVTGQPTRQVLARAEAATEPTDEAGEETAPPSSRPAPEKPDDDSDPDDGDETDAPPSDDASDDRTESDPSAAEDVDKGDASRPTAGGGKTGTASSRGAAAAEDEADGPDMVVTTGDASPEAHPEDDLFTGLQPSLVISGRIQQEAGGFERDEPATLRVWVGPDLQKGFESRYGPAAAYRIADGQARTEIRGEESGTILRSKGPGSLLISGQRLDLKFDSGISLSFTPTGAFSFDRPTIEAWLDSVHGVPLEGQAEIAAPAMQMTYKGPLLR